MHTYIYVYIYMKNTQVRAKDIIACNIDTSVGYGREGASSWFYSMPLPPPISTLLSQLF